MKDLCFCTRGRTYLLALAVALLHGALGCAFIESAAEITIGEPDIVMVEFETMVSVGEVNASLMGGMTDDGKLLAQSLGLMLGPKATYTTLRSTLCELWKINAVPTPRVDVVVVEGSDALKSVVLRLDVPIPANATAATCLNTGFVATAFVEFMPWTPEQAQEVNDQLNTDLADLGDAIVQVRFAFSRMDFLRGEEAVTQDVLEDFGIVFSADIEDDPTTAFDESRLEIVPFFLLGTISEETPQRFELDPDSPVTQSIKDTILKPSSDPLANVLQVEAFAAFKESELSKTAIEGSGFVIMMQPEVVINALKVIN